MNADSDVLMFHHIVKMFGARTVVNDVSLSIPRGIIVALAGVNGSGKSTLFRIAAGFVSATSGSIELASSNGTMQLLGLSPSTRVHAGLQYIAQQRRVIRGLSVIDNLRLAANSSKIFVSVDNVVACLADLRLTSLADKCTRDLSLAELTMLLLAKAYILGARVLIADEPFAGLDPREAAHASMILRLISERGTGVLLTDHSPRNLLDLADTLHIMLEGQLVYSGSASAARSSSEAQRLYFRNV